MKVAIIGAGGFLGSALSRVVLQSPAVERLALLDTGPITAIADPRVVTHTGDFADPALRAKLLDDADKVILLAAILGGAAENDPALARRINIDATLDLLDALRARGPTTRLVFASTIGVFGSPLPESVDDATPVRPFMLYGAQKRMIEVALANGSRRGWIDGLALRPAGIAARDGADARLRSAFVNRVFYAIARGEDIVLPVAEDDRTWLASVDSVARNFWHGACLPAAALGDERVLTLPALALRFGELVQALRRRYGGSRSRVHFEPQPDMVEMFGRFPPLRTPLADRLGFQGDRDVDDLVARAFPPPSDCLR